MEDQLLDAQALQNELSNVFPKTKKIIIISSYVTNMAIEWLLEKNKNNANISFVARLSPQDFASKSSTFEAIEILLKAGHTVKLLSNLHAKIYLIDKKYAFIGSANFTNNGLKLFGSGNLEASIKTSVTPEILGFINNICEKSITITLDILEAMKKEIKIIKPDKIPLQWSDDIINPALQLWTVDMLQEEIVDFSVTNKADRILLFGNIKINNSNIEMHFKKTKIYQWLTSELNQQDDKTLSFGVISARLHNDLNDDPLPYRKTVKQYIKNLLSYCKLFALNEIKISHPNYSEIIQFMK